MPPLGGWATQPCADRLLPTHWATIQPSRPPAYLPASDGLRLSRPTTARRAGTVCSVSTGTGSARSCSPVAAALSLGRRPSWQPDHRAAPRGQCCQRAPSARLEGSSGLRRCSPPGAASLLRPGRLRSLRWTSRAAAAADDAISNVDNAGQSASGPPDAQHVPTLAVAAAAAGAAAAGPQGVAGPGSGVGGYDAGYAAQSQATSFARTAGMVRGYLVDLSSDVARAARRFPTFARAAWALHTQFTTPAAREVLSSTVYVLLLSAALAGAVAAVDAGLLRAVLAARAWLAHQAWMAWGPVQWLVG